MLDKPSIAIIIINWKKYELTRNCINSVENSSFKNFKIILIDNESQNDFSDEINKSDKISSVAPKIISSNSVATVVDDNGEVCGELTKDQIIEILFSDKENHE